MTLIRTLFLALFIPALAAGKEPAKPISIDTIQVLKIAVQDERAVIKTPDDKMRIIKAGDVIRVGDKAVPGSGLRGGESKDEKTVAEHELRVIEIADGRIVLEEKNGDVIEKLIIRLIDGKQKMERLKKTGEHTSAIIAPAGIDVQGVQRGSRFH